MSAKFYIAYDGRAMIDPDEASVIEAIGNEFTREDYEMWEGYDAVLVEYDDDGSGTIRNERVIGHWSDGFDTLRSALTVSAQQEKERG